MRIGVQEALRQFVALIEDPRGGRGAGHEIYVDLGRGEMRAGRSLDALLSAYRLGARVAWRRFAAAGERAGLSPRTLYLLAESIFAYIDELSGDSIEGYASEQAAAAGAQQRRRQRLARLLIQDPPAAPAAIETAAAEAGWALPRLLAARAVRGSRPTASRCASTRRARAPRRFPTGRSSPRSRGRGRRRGPAPTVLIPDPLAPGRRGELEVALRGRRAALGPALPWTEAALGFARAREVLRLALEGALDGNGGGLLLAEDHGLALLLGADRRLASDVAERALAPLAEESERSRERLVETLTRWLRHRGRTEEVARALHVIRRRCATASRRAVRRAARTEVARARGRPADGPRARGRRNVRASAVATLDRRRRPGATPRSSRERASSRLGARPRSGQTYVITYAP